MNIEISDRTSWLSFRADWRAQYKDAVQDIRTLKAEIAGLRAKRRALGEAGEVHRHAADELQSDLWSLRRVASRLMQELDAAKELKARLMAEKADEKALAA